VSDRLLRFAFLCFGAVCGSFAALYLVQGHLLAFGPVPRLILAVILGALTGGFFVWVLFQAIGYVVLRGFSALESISAGELVAGAVGLITSLLIGVLLTFPLPRELPVVGSYLPSLVTATFGYVGLAIAVRKRQELSRLLPQAAGAARRGAAKPGGEPPSKILDTSAIIDGRIFDVARAGFLEGRLVVPCFVLAEAQRLADSADSLKRGKGRRALDLLGRFRAELGRDVTVDERDWPDLAEVDGKLVRLARETGGAVVTHDFNLAKICQLQGITVLNLHDLANAVRPALVPGEEVTLQLLKEGREPSQAVGYLEDGTMVVVENGRRALGETVAVVVTSAFQTAAGRMIFARLRGGANG
jgi:uncharacterized protein YacL